jgi:hypothetical protein
MNDNNITAIPISDDATLPSPLGTETYALLPRKGAKPILFTYNDLWMLIVCRETLDGDWVRARQSAGMVTDAAKKQALVDRLWKMERELNGLPMIPDNVRRLNLHRAHVWFNTKKVSEGK